MKIPYELEQDILQYCKANDITDIDKYLIRIIKTAQTIEKFGATPTIKEKIVEKIVEVTVDKIVEVEKIVELPVEKNVYITDDSQISLLTDEINTLKVERDEYKKKLDDLSKELELSQENLKIEKNRKDIYGE